MSVEIVNEYQPGATTSLHARYDAEPWGLAINERLFERLQPTP